MDNIRATLCTLFANHNGTEIIESVHHLRPHKRADKYIEEDAFCRFFREKYNIYSYDQIIGIHHILTSNWMKEYQTPALESHTKDSVFNVLLHYGTEILTEREQMPVCRYEQLFRWHLLVGELGEDIFTTSYLALCDTNRRRKRNMFSWNHCIGHDNAMLNHILNNPIADLHFHLKGSSINFDLNWLSLMNSIKMRKEEFNVLRKHQNPPVIISENSIPADDLYTAISKACLIRYLLFRKLTQEGERVSKEVREEREKEEKEIGQYLRYGNKWHDITFWLEPKLKAMRYFTGKHYGNHNVDYAIPHNLTHNELTDQDKYRSSVLSGERWLMYRMFCKIYSANKSFEPYITLFYAYLVEKNRLRHELIQLNKKIGFANFASYERRKELFIKEGSVYQTLIAHQAVHNSVKSRTDNYVEVRITPKDDAKKLSRAIKTTDEHVFDPAFLIPQNKKIPSLEPGETGYRINKDNYHYVLHYIKRPDEKGKEQSGLVPRNYSLREQVKKQTLATARVRDYNNRYARRIIGIDAANTEIGCRPEVFAQAFRYLKNFTPRQNLEYLTGTIQPQLGFTYHVGEDFMDLADGLRAMDEAVIFLNLSNGDRLGHALALGINPEAYYAKANHTVVMSQQDFLDNTVWLWARIRTYRISDVYPLIYTLEQWYETYYRKIFCNGNTLLKDKLIPSIYTYYQSWLLRGDDPFSYSYNGDTRNGQIRIGYNQYAQNKYPEEITEARKNIEAVKLYYRYHFDKDVKEKGRKSHQWKVDPLYRYAIQEIQQHMCRTMEKKHISIETNPTSNFRIASLEKYLSHPILRFFNHGIDTMHPPSNISVSINTDDLGVFSTCVEREFSLMALALEKHPEVSNNPRQIYDWIDRIREMGFEQRFFK